MKPSSCYFSDSMIKHHNQNLRQLILAYSSRKLESTMGGVCLAAGKRSWPLIFVSTQTSEEAGSGVGYEATETGTEETPSKRVKNA